MGEVILDPFFEYVFPLCLDKMKVKLEEGQRKGNERWWDECHVASLYPWALWLGNLSFKM